MGDGEMALEPGVQYGLSSCNDISEQKTLIFAKLTDSAYRSIQEYLKNRHKQNQKPTIQFLGNEGQLSIPSSHGLAEFNFSLFNSQDVEGPQSAFECVQQVAHKNLENLGNLSYKMRIQANDDVYETTRHRMAVAEENNKNKCTRVIKANGPDIGRKVKVKRTGRIIPPYSKTLSDPLTTILNSSQSKASTANNKPAASNSSSSSNHPAATRSPEKKISDLMRRPIKERLIHLLALRPFKKPELYERITREGIRDRERSIIMTVLKQVAIVRDNTYELHRPCWNDVQEDWPFYNDQERATLKRRKPQNLTPPASDGGSSGSGHSPNSIHAGSPPAITAPPANLQTNKRPGYYQGSDGLPTKKPRISHYRKPEPISFVSSGALERSSSASASSSSGVSAAVIGGDRTIAGSNSAYGANSNSSAANKNDGFGDVWELRQQAQRERNSRVDYRAERIANSDVPRDIGSSYAAAAAIAAIPDGSFNRPSCLTQLSLSPSDSARSSSHHQSGHSRDSGVAAIGDNAEAGSSSHEVNVDRRDRSDRSRDAREERNREREFRNRNTAATLGPNFHNEASSSAVPAYNANVAAAGVAVAVAGPSLERPAAAAVAGPSLERPAAAAVAGPSLERPAVAAIAGPPLEWPAAAVVAGPPLERLANPGEYPDYLRNYTTVTSLEQKRRYRADFNANYEEYRKLHAVVAKVGQHFSILYDLMKEQLNLGKQAIAQMYIDRIHNDYNLCKKNRKHQESKARFEYLHDKLTHIKTLIGDYEKAVASQNVAGNGANSANVGDVNRRHY